MSPRKRALILAAIGLVGAAAAWANWPRSPLPDDVVANHVIDFRKADSSFHRALHISYPRPDQVAAARSRGEPAGGLVMIHGLPNGVGYIGRLHLLMDWTLGCIAVTNAEIEEIWRVVPDGTRGVIKP